MWTGQGDDYKTDYKLDFPNTEKNYRLTAGDFSKQKALDADPKAIKQFIFPGKTKSTVANARILIHYTIEQSKETILWFLKGTAKVLK